MIEFFIQLRHHLKLNRCVKNDRHYSFVADVCFYLRVFYEYILPVPALVIDDRLFSREVEHVQLS